jgi:hypothetical protein
MVHNNQKLFFMLFLYHVEAIWAPPNGPKKVSKDPHVGGMYGPMCKVKNKPLTKSLRPLFMDKWFETTRKQVFMLFFISFWGHFGTPNGPKMVSKGLLVEKDVWLNI